MLVPTTFSPDKGNLQKPVAEPVFATEIFGECRKSGKCEAMPGSKKPCEAGFRKLPKPFGSAICKKTIEALSDMYPNIGVTTIGTSRMGRPIHALTIGNGERAIMFNAAHHANEWITSVLVMRFIEEYAQNCIPGITLHVIPMVNPDGVDLVTGNISPKHPAYKKAKKMTGKDTSLFPNNWKANIIGVDLNSNYPAGWQLAKQHKHKRGYTKPGPHDYVGETPLSEPETIAMAAYTMANDFTHTISLHTQGEEIYWQYQNYMPPGAENLAKRLSAASGYKLEAVPDTSSHGGYRDWFIEKWNRPGMTIECGLGTNPLPISDFNDIYKRVGPLLWEALR